MSLILSRNSNASKHIYFIEVAPHAISHIKLFNTRKLPLLGEQAICGACYGVWDMMKVPYKYHYYYRSLYRRIKHDKAWHELPINKIKGKNIEKFNKKNELLIKSMMENGYLSQNENGNTRINQTWFQIGKLSIPPEIIVGMDRKGRLFQLANGRRRLAIAQIIDLHKVTAVLTLYHEKAVDQLPDKRRIIQGKKEDFIKL